MRLSAKPIITYNTVNSFSYGNQWTVRAGDTIKLYFQIIDLDQSSIVNLPGQNLIGATPVAGSSSNFPGLRYLVGVGSQNEPYSVKVTFPSLDDTKTIVCQATQADFHDRSIWTVSIPSVQVPGGGNVLFTVNEGSSVYRFSVLNLIGVEYVAMGGSC